MATTTTLPPTTHALPSTHRAHLIRSTRKLGNILGETPLLLDPHPSSSSHSHSRSSSVSSISSTDSRRSGRIFADAPRSSSFAPADTASLSSSNDDAPRSKSSMDAPRPMLFLRLAAQRPLSSVSLVSPRSPAFALDSPITPTFAVDRRKKMAKLTRTLGANVPPELVFSSAPPDERTPTGLLMPMPGGGGARHGPPRSSSFDIPVRPRRGSYSSSSSKAGLASPTREATDGGWVDLGAPVSSSYPPSPQSPHYAKYENADADGARPSTTSRGTVDTRYLSRHVEYAAPASRSASPFYFADADNAEEGEEYWGGEARADGTTHRKEAGWSGEWSGVQGMDDVVNRLRGLKMK
ncbi:hypothetical protein C8R46DRAFT_1231222 [Mycena filopes]|nr:hypothetical protein C8R46DRAFT_1231222 [Mycena filopes]